MPTSRRNGAAASFARNAIPLIAILAIALVGYYAGKFSAPSVLPDLDLNAFTFRPMQRVEHWAFFSALICGFVGAAVIFKIEDLCRSSRSSPKRQTMSGSKKLVRLLALAVLPATFSWAAAFSRHEGAARSSCVHNLKQIALAMHNYHDDFGCLPPAFIPDENGLPKHSWRVLILPYLEKTGIAAKGDLQRLYDSYNFAEPWNGPTNRNLAHRMPVVYICPNDPGRRDSTTSYLAITGEHSAFPGSRSTAFASIRDEKSKTILVVETRNSGINWLEPNDYPISALQFGRGEAHQPHVGGNHSAGDYACFADGSIRFLREKDCSPETLKALATIDGGEKLAPDWP